MSNLDGPRIPNPCVLAVDVGTGSARAAVFGADGVRRSFASAPIAIWHPHAEWAEQSSDDIWRAVCAATSHALDQAAVSAEQVVGIGFDATCSLVVVDPSGAPLPVSPGADPERNVIVWMDHRALAEADEINSGRHDVLKYVGGEISPEMETPKLLWLRRHMPESYKRAGRFLDLADFLSWRATGSNIRSECTTVCKWTYLAHEHRWDQEFFRRIGLDDLPSERSGTSGEVRPIGSVAGHVTSRAAAELGVNAGTPVAVGAIDAHAGGIGLLGMAMTGGGGSRNSLGSALALIGGTSSCHMAVSAEPRAISGVWGPYFGAMVPGMWLTEGGQSAAGSLIDFVIDTHPASHDLAAAADRQGRTRYDVLNALLAQMAASNSLRFEAELTRDLHVLDYHLGNRSPYADPRARGVVDGCSFDVGIEALARVYLSTVQAVAYGARRIVEALGSGGYHIDRILVTGGGTKNPLWLSQHADATGLPLLMGDEPESVVLGSAILAAVAAGLFGDIPAAMSAMARPGQNVSPRAEAKAYHDSKYECYERLYACHLENRRRMASVPR